MRVEDLNEAKDRLVDAYIVLGETIADISDPEDSERQSIEGYQRTIQGVVGELAIKIGVLNRES